MSEERKTIRPDQLDEITNLSGNDLFIVFQAGKYKSLKFSKLQQLINAGSSSDVETLIFTTDSPYFIDPEFLLEQVIVIPTAPINLTIGSTNGADDIMPEFPIQANQGTSLELNLYTETGKTIYFNGITSQTTVRFYKR